MSLGKVPDWVALQTKVFTRWINQKFQSANRPERIDNVLTGFGDGKIFGAFLEALSETPCNAKWNKNKMRVSHVDNINMALEFAKKLGVTVKNFPQATDFIDGQERPVLGFVWACILKFLKFGDDADDSLSAKDALLLWVSNRTSGYKGVSIDKFPNSFKDGLALCALIHSSRPALVDYNSLEGGDGAIEAAFDGAEKYFEMEKFVTVDEFKRFDEISMVVYVSDYYYGMARERKKDRAARRIGKLIKFTKDMDARKVEFNERSLKFRDHVKDVQKVLGDRSIDNTLQGAVGKLDAFADYKKKDKGVLIGDQLNLESQYNVIATRLSDKSRPIFNPPAGCQLVDVEKTMTELEESESERNVALHAELNRQRKLLKMDAQHKDRDAKLHKWIDAKEAYLNTKEDVRSVGAAQLQLTILMAYETEVKDISSGSVAELKKLGDVLDSEKYERTDEVRAREKVIDEKFSLLANLAVKKTAILEDDLKRETYRADTRVKAAGHKERHGKISQWVDKKEAYLNTRETIDNTPEAALQVTLLSQYNKESKSYYNSHVKALKVVGQEIRDAKYESDLSSWTFETPEELDERENDLDARFKTLGELHDVKKPILDDHLARELHKDKLRRHNKQHAEAFAKIEAWVAEKRAYLETREVIDNTAEAQLQLGLLENYVSENQSFQGNQVAELKKLGAHINADVYKTEHSEYVWEDPAALKEREDATDKHIADLQALHDAKRPIMDDHVARELHKDKLRRHNRQHAEAFAKIEAWVVEKKAYLETREVIDNTAEAQLQLGLLENYVLENKSFQATTVAGLKELGAQINADVHRSEYSEYVWEDPAGLKAREDAVDKHIVDLQSLHDIKRPIMDCHVARESHKDRLRIAALGHSDLHAAIVEWYNEKEAYLQARPAIESVAEAQLQISGLNNYFGEKEMVTETSVAQLKADGAAINADVYKGHASEYVWEDPQALASRESDVDSKWATLDDLSSKLKADLDAALVREQEKEKLRLKWTDLAGGYIRWTREQSDSAVSAIFGYSLEEVQAYEGKMKAEDSATQATGSEKKATYDGVWADMDQIGVKENAYCQETPETLQQHREKLDSELSRRGENYQAELAKQVKHDNLCKEYADLVNGFSLWLSQEKDAVSKGSGPKEEQLAKVESLINDKERQAAQLNPIREAEAKLEAEGVEQNRHTSLSSKDVEIQYDGFTLLLNRKTEMLKDLIELEKLKGVTADEWEEFSENFAKFDKDSTGKLDLKEFKGLLYSVGEEMTKAQAKEVFDTYAEGNVINREGYLEYMVKLAGDSDTKDNVLDGFLLLSSGKVYCVREDLARIMTPEDVEFIYSTINPKDEGHDYEGWVEDMFSR
mmetsp:Transcript_26216/g.36477  ORF Transcript_26216/g.36477 Transcript_26216/m.36477 type:complete len:1355 (-) Transcript_26216:126-4190(-)